MEILVKLKFNDDWKEYNEEKVNTELIVEDAIRELANGVTYEIVDIENIPVNVTEIYEPLIEPAVDLYKEYLKKGFDVNRFFLGTLLSEAVLRGITETKKVLSSKIFNK